MSTIDLPTHACLPCNRCNLPAVVLGSAMFQKHPTALYIDGVMELHKALFTNLDKLDGRDKRAENFQDYIKAAFLLDNLDEAGFDPRGAGTRRDKADYLRLLRGWLFDPDGREAAVLKAWVESRFGLRTQRHKGALDDIGYQEYIRARARGLYNTNALEAQLDLLYTYCQYESHRQYPNQTHIKLYRGLNRIEEHEILARPDKHSYILLLNNLNSFTRGRERAGEFGDHIAAADVPLVKLFYAPELLPGLLRGEEEYLVIGGVYRVCLCDE